MAKVHHERPPAEPEKKARRVADRTAATGGQAKDGLSASPIGSGGKAEE